MSTRPLRMMIASNWVDWWAFRPIFRLIHGVRVERENNDDGAARAVPRRNGAGAYQASAHALREGEAVGIFPEGGLQTNGTLGPFRNGAARLSLATGAPLVPCAIIGSREALPWPRHFPSPRRITIRSGPILRFTDDSIDAPAVAAATERVREAVRALLDRGHGR